MRPGQAGRGRARPWRRTTQGLGLAVAGDGLGRGTPPHGSGRPRGAGGKQGEAAPVGVAGWPGQTGEGTEACVQGGTTYYPSTQSPRGLSGESRVAVRQGRWPATLDAAVKPRHDRRKRWKDCCPSPVCPVENRRANGRRNRSLRTRRNNLLSLD